MVMNRIKDLPDMYDTDDENAWGPGGLLPNPREMNDFGEEALSYKKAIDRAVRRLHRDDSSGGALGRLIGSYRKRKKKGMTLAEDDRKEARPTKRQRDHHGQDLGLDGSRGEGQREEALDDLDLALLGEGQDEDDEMDDETGTDDVEDGDMTEEEVVNDA